MNFTDAELDGVRITSFLLARRDRDKHTELVHRRRLAGVTQEDIASMLGLSMKQVRKLERYDADPKLSLMRRYECAVITFELRAEVNHDR